MNWIACRVKTGKEYEIRAKLKQIDEKAEIWIPRKYYIEFVDKVAKDKSERMLPGYILIGSETSINPLLLKDFLKYVGPISEDEIALLKAQEGQKKEHLEVGSKVLVVEGPFQGCKGYVLRELEGGMKECKLTFQGMEISMNMKEDFINVIS